MKGRLVREAVSIAFLAALVIVLRGTVFGIVHVPGQTMRPTLLPGDSVYVNRLAYALHVPFSERALLRWGSPARGDLVLFTTAVDDALELKRIVGLPGDRISIGGREMTINGRPVESAVQTDAELYAAAESSAKLRTILLERLGERSPGHFIERPEAPGSALPRARTAPATSSGGREFVVPPGRFFCLGDNRDEAPENRSWAFVDAARVAGKVVGVAYSLRPEPTQGQGRWRGARFLHRAL